MTYVSLKDIFRMLPVLVFAGVPVFLAAPSNAAEKPQEAYFQAVTLADGAPFVVRLRDPKLIQQARDILSGKEIERIHLAGKVVKAPAIYNDPWSFHVDPDSVSFFEMAAEVCDSTVSLVEAHLSEVGGSFLPKSHWCPWSSRLLREVSPPNRPVVSVVSAASMTELAISPGSLASVLGERMTEATESAINPELPTKLAGIEVELRRRGNTTPRKAPLTFASPQRINFVVPEDISDGLYSVRVVREAAPDMEAFAPVESPAPGIFFGDRDGKKFAAATLLRVRPGGTSSVEPLLTVDTGSGAFVPVPIKFGSPEEKLYLSLYGTGLAKQKISVLIDGEEFPTLFSGPQGASPGLDQINLEFPTALTPKTEAVIVVSGRSAEGEMMESVPVTILCPSAGGRSQ